jgi:hypothetical protein
MQALHVGLTAIKTRVERSRSRLCSKCKAIFDNWWDRDNWTYWRLLCISSTRPGRQHHNIVRLQRSASKGCPVCVLLLRGLDGEAIQQLMQEGRNRRGLVHIALALVEIPDVYLIRVLFYPGTSAAWEVAINAYPSGKFKAFTSRPHSVTL